VEKAFRIKEDSIDTVKGRTPKRNAPIFIINRMQKTIRISSSVDVEKPLCKKET
jgi:hypothetical protein